VRAPRPARAALLLGLALAGCTRLFDTASLDPLATAQGYCQARYDAHYALNVRCAGYDPTWASLRPKFWYQEDCARTATSVAEGRMTYDRTSGEACLAAYAAPSCSDPEGVLPACAAALAPHVVQGGECTRNQECLGPGSCGSPDGTCPGHCTGFGALGDACDALHGPCGPGLWCDGTTSCAARRGSGEACEGNCLENLSCDAGFCSYVAGAGEACGALACDPAQPLYCGGSACLPLPAFGEPCAPGGGCGAGLYCSAGDGLCHQVPTEPQADGLPCDAHRFCGATSFCDTLESPVLCKPRKPVGGACTTGDQECLPPAHCDTSGPQLGWSCAAPAIAGTPCAPGGCAQGAWCHVVSGGAGTCATEPDLGQPCGQLGIGDSASCLQGYCALATPGDATGSCQPTKAGGAACTGSEQCSSFACDPVAGTCHAVGCPSLY